MSSDMSTKESDIIMLSEENYLQCDNVQNEQPPESVSFVTFSHTSTGVIIDEKEDCSNWLIRLRKTLHSMNMNESEVLVINPYDPFELVRLPPVSELFWDKGEMIWDDFADLVGEVVLPDIVVERLKTIKPTPDHIHDVEQASGHEFLETIFLPAIRDEVEIDLHWILIRLVAFKLKVRDEHPNDLAAEFPLMEIIGRELMLLAIRYQAEEDVNGYLSKVGRIVSHANNVYSTLIEEYGDILNSL